MMRSRSQSNVGHQCMLRKLFCVTFRNRRSNTDAMMARDTDSDAESDTNRVGVSGF